MTDDFDEYPNGDYMNACSAVLQLMCDNCPNYQKCMGGEPDFMNTNHDQMRACLEKLGDRLAGNYPGIDDIETDPDGESTGCCEDVAGSAVAVICAACPKKKTCMPHLDDPDWDYEMTVNYSQLIECLGRTAERLAGTFPETVKYQWVS